MRRKIRRLFHSERRFRNEFRRQLRMLIIVTLGFTIAFTWRQTIFDASQALVQLFTDVQSSTTLSVLTSLFITIVSILLIYITAHYLKNNGDNY
ncbi:MAG: hypothetical protein ACE5ES_04850 [Candidatus Nanoarchaeia archaeon]